ncbi:MAG: efflux RND transporter periplasmic adaptor subunit [Parachlamydiaceae bacterium]|nr:efflux RND transporter periplasmic adaptor subunit [Parachlamydiaceae bacterium]
MIRQFFASVLIFSMVGVAFFAIWIGFDSDPELIEKSYSTLSFNKNRELLAKSENVVSDVEVQQNLSKPDVKPVEASQEDLTNFNSDPSLPPYEVPNLNPETEFKEEAPSNDFPVIFKAFYRGILSAEVTAIVEKITHRMGERFKEGELLVQLDDTIFQGYRVKAVGNVEKAKAELASKEKLFKDGIASIFEIKTAEANLGIANSDLINADHAINGCSVRAPFDGKVVNILIEEHELIQEGKPLIEIVNDDYLIGQVLSPARLLPILAIGRPVNIFVQETGTIEVGKILRLDAIIDPASSLLKVDIIVDNKNQKLRSGMIGRVILSDEALKLMSPDQSNQKSEK